MLFAESYERERAVTFSNIRYDFISVSKSRKKDIKSYSSSSLATLSLLREPARECG